MILIFGCGYLGERLADLLHATGHQVVAVTLHESSALTLQALKAYQVTHADLTDISSLEQLRKRLPAEPQQIIHIASSNRGGAEQYQRVFVDGIQHLCHLFPRTPLLFTSSSSVYAQRDGSWVNEQSPTQAQALTSQALLRAESIVLNNGNGCVARLSGIYGPQRSFLLKQYLLTQACREGFTEAGRWLNQIHREDAARALVHLLQRESRGIYNISDQQPLTQLECYQQLAKRFLLKLPPLRQPQEQRKRPWTHKRVSSQRLLDSNFQFLYPNFLTAIDTDQDLVASILAQVPKSAHPIE